MHRDQLRALVDKGIRAGARRLSLGVWEWDIAGSCQDPVTREFFARKDRGNHRENDWAPGDEHPLRLILHVRCRRCRDCARLRRREWTVRAIAELHAATRSWFGTLTLSPESLFFCEVSAEKRLRRGGTLWEDLDHEARYVETCHEISQEITRYLKRIRKNSGAKLKYVAVFERHKSGAPHLHMLCHEYLQGSHVRKSQLDAAWNLGFSHWRLVPAENTARAAIYVAKYISKQGGRVRASLRYGRATRPEAIGTPQGVRERQRTTHPPAVFNSDPPTAPADGARHARWRYSVGDRVSDILQTSDW